MDTLISVALLGATKSGKTSLTTNFKDNLFYEGYEATIGVIPTKIEQTFNEKKYVFTVYDASGDKKFQTIMGPHLRSADVYLFVCDLTDEKSLDTLEALIETLPSNTPFEQKQFILVGTKADLTKERKITPAAFEKKASALNFNCVEVSSKTGDGVMDLFEHVATEYLNAAQKKGLETKPPVPASSKAVAKKDDPTFLRKHYPKIIIATVLFTIISVTLLLTTNMAAPLAAYLLLLKPTLTTQFAANLADALIMFASLIVGLTFGTVGAKITDVVRAKKTAPLAASPTPPNTNTPTTTKNILARIIERKPPITHAKIQAAEELNLPSAEAVYSAEGDDDDVFDEVSDSEESSRKNKRRSLYV